MLSRIVKQLKPNVFQHILRVTLPLAVMGCFSLQGVSAADSTAAKDRPVTDKWALIVGIGKFQQPNLPQLRYAAKDAQDFRDFLVSKGNFKPDHVRLLLNEKATRKQILSGFDKFLGRVARKDDLVVVYFSTHGSPESSDSRGKSYLVGFDTDKEDLFATAIPMSDITDLVKERITSDRVLLVMDTCFSGASIPNGSKSVGEVGNLDASKIAQGSGQLVICSSSPKEKSWESRRYDNGIFTKKLIDSLTIKGPATKLSAAFSATADEVENEVREDQGIRQHPVLATAGWKGEDLMLAAPPSSPRDLPAAVRDILDPDSTVTDLNTYDRSLVRTTESTPSLVPSSSQASLTIPGATPLKTPTAPVTAVPATKATPPSATTKAVTPAVTPKKVEVKQPAKSTKVPPSKKSPSQPKHNDSPERKPSKPPPPVAPLWTREDH